MSPEQKTKILFGKILGEIYVLQKMQDPEDCRVSDGVVFGLLNGFERVVDDQIKNVGFLSSEKFEAVEQYLDQFYRSDTEMTVASIHGFYQIEHEIQSVSRDELIAILKFFKADGKFLEAILAIENGDSPVEANDLDLDEYDF